MGRENCNCLIKGVMATAHTPVLSPGNASNLPMAPKGHEGERAVDQVLVAGLAGAPHESADPPSDLLFGLEDYPPWYLSLLYGFQVGGK